MKKPAFIILLIISALIANGQNWSYSRLSQKKARIEVISSGSKIYLFSGNIRVDGVVTHSDTMEVFDVNTNQRKIFMIPTGGRRDLGMTTYGNKIYFGGGAEPDNKPSSRINIFDTVTNTWSTKELSEGRIGLTATASSDLIFFAGGVASNYSNVVDILDINGDSLIKDYFNLFSIPPGHRAQHTSISTGSKILFSGGDYNGTQLKLVHIYDIKERKWLEDDTLPQPRSGLFSFNFRNKIYFAGGFLEDISPADQIDIFDIGTETWDSFRIPLFFKQPITFQNLI